MNSNFLSLLCLCLALIIVGCNKDNILASDATQSKQHVALKQTKGIASRNSTGATQVSGVGSYTTIDECNAVDDFTAVIKMTGDLVGCLYVYVDEYECSPSGTYREKGREYFVGTYNGMTGTFWTSYKFEAKYEGCATNGGPLGAEIFGRCQHPIVVGSGTGDFTGVTGRLYFKDDVEVGNFRYKGHLQF